MRLLALLPLTLLLGCPEPDSVDLGGSCKEAVECKPPSDQCVFAVGKKLCTMTCTADSPCPETFVCARMDITLQEPGAEGQKITGEGGYCLPEADVPPRAAKIRPKKRKKSGKK